MKEREERLVRREEIVLVAMREQRHARAKNKQGILNFDC